MNAHERSKKHAKAVWELKKQMRKENKEFDLDRDVRGWKRPEEYKPIDGDDAKQDDYISAVEEGEDVLSDVEARKEEPTVKPVEFKEEEGEEESTRPSPAPSSEAEDSENDDYVSTSTFNARLRGTESDLSNLALNTSDGESKATPTTRIGKAKAKKAKRAAAAAAAASTGSEEGKANMCATCRQSFPSNTKMFNHLRDNPSHATPVPSAGGGGGGGGGGKKGKGKGRRK